MLNRDRARLDQIERELLDESKPLAGALRKCLALGGELRSAPLREWASNELNGYEEPGAELPEYRLVAAAIMIDGAVPGHVIERQRIALTELPDFVRGHVSETVELRGGVGTLEELIRSAGKDRLVKISLPVGGDIARYMSQNMTGRILSVYWGVSTAAIYSVLDRVRTVAVDILSELRASAPDEEPLQPDTADQAVNVVLHGGKRHQVTITAAQAQGGSIASTPQPTEGESWWTRTGTVWTIIGVIVAIIALYVAYRQWQG